MLLIVQGYIENLIHKNFSWWNILHIWKNKFHGSFEDVPIIVQRSNLAVSNVLPGLYGKIRRKSHGGASFLIRFDHFCIVIQNEFFCKERYHGHLFIYYFYTTEILKILHTRRVNTIVIEINLLPNHFAMINLTKLTFFLIANQLQIQYNFFVEEIFKYFNYVLIS